MNKLNKTNISNKKNKTISNKKNNNKDMYKIKNKSNRKNIKNKNNSNRKNKTNINRKTKNISNRKNNKNNNKNNKNNKLIKGGSIVNIHPNSKKNPYLHKSNGQGIMRLNNYLCFKEDKLNDFSDMVYELFFRRIQEKTMLDDVDRRVNLDLTTLQANTDAQKEKNLNQIINNYISKNPVYK